MPFPDRARALPLRVQVTDGHSPFDFGPQPLDRAAATPPNRNNAIPSGARVWRSDTLMCAALPSRDGGSLADPHMRK